MKFLHNFNRVYQTVKRHSIIYTKPLLNVSVNLIYPMKKGVSVSIFLYLNKQRCLDIFNEIQLNIQSTVILNVSPITFHFFSKNVNRKKLINQNRKWSIYNDRKLNSLDDWLAFSHHAVRLFYRFNLFCLYKSYMYVNRRKKWTFICLFT
jgi:hypothetical protein